MIRMMKTASPKKHHAELWGLAYPCHDRPSAPSLKAFSFEVESLTAGRRVTMNMWVEL